MKQNVWPHGFTKGAPTTDGCFVCALHASGRRINFVLVDIENVTKYDAGDLGVKPGLAIITEEGKAFAITDYAVIVAHLPISDCSWITMDEQTQKEDNS